MAHRMASVRRRPGLCLRRRCPWPRGQRLPNRLLDRARKNQLAEPDPAPDGGAADIAPEVAARIEATARRLVGQLTGAQAGSADFSRAARAIDRIGEREIRATAEIAARFTERPVRAIRDILEDDAPLAAHV